MVDMNEIPKKILDTVNKFLPHRFLSSSKSIYRYECRENLVVFNASIYSKSLKKAVFKGDVDITLQHEALLKLAKALKDTLYVCYEGYFHKEEVVPEFDKEYVFMTDGTKHDIGKELKKEHSFLDGAWRYRPIMKFKEGSKEITFSRKILIRDLYSFFWKKDKPLEDILINFYIYILKELGYKKKDLKRLKVQSVWITPRLKHKFLAYMEVWSIQSKQLYHPCKREQAIGMTWLNYGPCEFSRAPEWARDDEVYIIEDIFVSND